MESGRSPISATPAGLFGQYAIAERPCWDTHFPLCDARDMPVDPKHRQDRAAQTNALAIATKSLISGH